MAMIPVFDSPVLIAICNILGHTTSGLTGSEIGRHLAILKVDDHWQGSTKSRRLFEALSRRQEVDRCGNLVVAFICDVMNPVLYTDKPQIFEQRQFELNKVLILRGYQLADDGRICIKEVAKTLTETEERAGKLRQELKRRNVHPDVLAFCSAEIIQNDYFHAVFEATKSIAEKIRCKSGLQTDGARIVDEAFGIGGAGLPYLAFNTLQTESERTEHIGFMNIIKGVFGVFRNIHAHTPRVKLNVSEQETLDILTILSYIHRRLDGVVRTTRK